MNTIHRYPRPKGLTNLSIRYNEDKSKTNKGKLNKALITYYLSNQLLYIYPMQYSKLNPFEDGSSTKPKKGKATKPITPQQKIKLITKKNPTHNHHQYQIRIIEYNELCIMFGFSSSKVQRLLNKYLAKQGKSYLDNEVKNDTLNTTRATLFGLIGKSLNRLSAQEGWEAELKAISRDYGYKPSMVKEANSAIGGTQQMLDQLFKFGTGILKGFEPNPQAPNYQQNNYYGDQPQGDQPLDEAGYLLTPTKALEMMDRKGLLSMPTEDEHLALHAHYITPDIPSTQALPSDAQGIQKKEMVLVKDTELTHTDRREEGLDTLNPIDVDPIDDDYGIVE